jgi:hypothetical protein
MDLTDICTIFYPTAIEHTFFPTEKMIYFYKIDHILGYNSSHNKYNIITNNIWYFIRSKQNKARNEKQENL